MSWSKSVFSSNVSEVGWDDDLQAIIVRWIRSGRVSAYLGADEALALELSNAPSVGGMLNNQIKPYYEHRYL